MLEGEGMCLCILSTVSESIGLDKSGYQVNISPQKHMLWFSLEAPWQGASNEYPQHMFLWRNKQKINTFGLKKASNHEL